MTRAFQPTQQAKTPSVKGPGPRNSEGKAPAVSRSNPVWQALALNPAFIQPKLSISQPDDPYELEADRIAERVVRMPTPQASNSHLSFSSAASSKAQPKCASCREEDEAEQRLRRKNAEPETSAGHAAPTIIRDVLQGAGQSLDSTTRSFMEQRFNHAFEHVRVHTDARAAESARAVNALAYTVGNRIVFGANTYRPETQEGKRLLAHELAHTVQQSSADLRLIQRDPPPGPDFILSAGEISVNTSGDETTLILPDLSPGHRVRLRVAEPTLRGHQAFAWQFIPAEPTLHSHSTLRIVAAPGVVITPEGWPTGWHIADPQHPALEIYRVQDPALVPPQGEPIIPSRYVGEHSVGSAGPPMLSLVPQFIVRSTVSSVDIVHIRRDRDDSSLLSRGLSTPPNVTVHIEVRNLSGSDRFAYQIIEGDFITGQAAEIRVVKTASTPLVVRAGAGVLPVRVRVWVVDRLSDVPPQGRPLGGVGRELTSIPAEMQLTVEQQLACAIIPGVISLIPIVGEIYMIADFAYGLATGRDPICRQRRDELGHMMAGLGALLGAVSLGVRGVSLIVQATRRTEEAASALITATRELSPADRATILRLQRAVERGETLSAAESEALARILRQLEARVGELGGGPGRLGGLLNGERTGFVEPELQQAYQSYLAGAGERPLGPEAWARTPQGESAFRSLFGETSLGPETSGLPTGGARSRPPGRPYPESPHPHVQQQTDIWCGAACGEMAARRLGVEVSQADLAASPHFQPRRVIGSMTIEGGFQTEGLTAALNDLAPVPGRRWVGGSMDASIETPEGLASTLAGFLRNSQSSIILRIGRGRHWIIVDEVLADGRVVIRDPGHRGARAITSQELFNAGPTGDVVMSFRQAGVTP